LNSEPIKKALENFGLTDKESEIYILLAKHGVLTGGQISKRSRIKRPNIYRILKNLEEKEVVESTLEAPTRFTAILFEKVLEKQIRNKQKELEQIEKSKKDLLDSWKKISKFELEPEVARFSVIEGNKKIYSRIAKMIEKTANNLSAILTVKDLVRAEQFGVFDFAYNHPLKSKVQFNFLTEINNQNLKAIKLLKNKLKAELDFKGRNPELGLSLFPRMVLKDDQEILFFISTRTESDFEEHEVCLATNCNSLVQAFSKVFQDIWGSSTTLEKKIEEIETGIKIPKTFIINDVKVAKVRYDEVLKSANKEILMITSSEGLNGLHKKLDYYKRLTEKGISIKVMAPIINENLEAIKELLNFCEIRHTPKSYVQTILVDGKHLFQFKTSPLSQISELSIFEGTFYSNDSENVEKSRFMFNDIWKRAQPPSRITLDSIDRKMRNRISIPKETDYSIYRKTFSYTIDPHSKDIQEKDIISKIVNAKKYPGKNWQTNFVRYYGTSARGVIHPPKIFNLPDLLIATAKNNSQSSFGAEHILRIFMEFETDQGMKFLPVVLIQNNTESLDFRKKVVVANTPAKNNIQLVNDDQFQIRIHGNTLFCGWTIPIQLTRNYILPPSCVLFEGYGAIRTGIIRGSLHNRKQVSEFNLLDAFVTFYHPSSSYSGPGTDGTMVRDLVFTSFP
jgi:sugar-specific transcriptional regulator TrmB